MSELKTDLQKFYMHCLNTEQGQVAELVSSAYDRIKELELDLDLLRLSHDHADTLLKSCEAALLDRDSQIAELREPQYTTPAKGDAMPDTLEAWKHLYGLAGKLMLRQKDEISRLKQRINKMEQKSNGL